MSNSDRLLTFSISFTNDAAAAVDGKGILMIPIADGA
jgi:hypothetical protein